MDYYLIGIIYVGIYLINLITAWSNLKYHYKVYEVIRIGDIVWELCRNLNPFRLFTTFGSAIEFIFNKFDWVLGIPVLEKKKK